MLAYGSWLAISPELLLLLLLLAKPRRCTDVEFDLYTRRSASTRR